LSGYAREEKRPERQKLFRIWGSDDTYSSKPIKSQMWLETSLPVGGGLPKHNAAALDQLIALIAPNRAFTDIASAPDGEAE
jgi:hypothetical protein